MACRPYNTGRCLQLRLFNCPNFGVHFKSVPLCRFYTIVNPPFFIYCAKIMDFSETFKQSPRIFRSTMYTTDSCHIKISSLALN